MIRAAAQHKVPYLDKVCKYIRYLKPKVGIALVIEIPWQWQALVT